MKMEKIKRFLVFCEPCSYKKIHTSDMPQGLTQIKVAAVPGKIPTLKNPNHKLSVIDIDDLISKGWKKVDGDGKQSLVFELNGQTKHLVSVKNEWKESIVNLPVQPQCKKVKCPQCGRGVVVKPLPDVYSKSYDEIDKREQMAREEKEKRKRIEDGTPPKFQPPDFLG